MWTTGLAKGVARIAKYLRLPRRYHADGSVSNITVDHFKYTGTVVFRCDGKGDKDYRWELVKKKDNTGGGVNSDKCEFSDLNIGHEIETDITGHGILRAEEASILTLISTAQLSEPRPTPFHATLQPQLSLMTFPVFLTAFTD